MSPIVDAISTHFGLQRQPASIVAMLHAAGGEFVNSRRLWEACDIPSRNGLSVQAHHIRVHGVAIEAVKGRGYRLTAVGLEQCRAALRAHAEHLTAAADELSRAAA